MASSFEPAMPAVTLTAASGALVPIATMVRPTTKAGMPAENKSPASLDGKGKGGFSTVSTAPIITSVFIYYIIYSIYCVLNGRTESVTL